MKRLFHLPKVLLLWAFTVFSLAAAALYLPGLAGFCGLVLAALALPIDRWQKHLPAGVKGIRKALLCVALFFVMCFTAPEDTADVAQLPSELTSPTLVTTEVAPTTEAATEIITEPATEPPTEVTTEATTEATTAPTEAPVVIITAPATTVATTAATTEATTVATTEAPVEVTTEVPTETIPEATTVATTEAPLEVTTIATTEAPVEVTTEVPTEAPTEAVTEAPTEAATEATESEQVTVWVWIPKSGSKYHSNPSCSNMKNPSQATLEEAISWGYGACSKCN